jgi:hypothetical protein
MHATFMQVIEPDGHLAYADRTFGLPLFHLHEGAVFEMSMTTPFFFDLNGDLVVLAMMHNGGKRYRFGASSPSRRSELISSNAPATQTFICVHPCPSVV